VEDKERLDHAVAQIKENHERLVKEDYFKEKELKLKADAAKQKQVQDTKAAKALGAWMDTNGVAFTGAGRTPQQRYQRLNDIIENNPGKSTEELGKMLKTGQLEYGVEKKETQTAAAIEGKINYAVQEINQMAPYVESLSAKVPRGQFVPYNKLQQMTEAQLSDPNLASLKMAMTTLSNAYDVLAARGGTDMAKREENRRNFDTANSPEALSAVLKVMRQEANIAQSAAQRATTVQSPAGAQAPKVLRFDAQGNALQ